MDLVEVQALVLRVRTATQEASLAEALSELRDLFPGCGVVQSAAWGLVFIATPHSKFSFGDMLWLSRCNVFDNVVLKERDGSYQTLSGDIPPSEVKIYDLDIFSTWEASGESRWSLL